MRDRQPVNLTLIFNDGQALFLHDQQMLSFALEAKGVALEEGIENPTRSDVVGHLFQLSVGFVIASGGVDAEADNVNDALAPYLIHFTEIPPINPNAKPPAPSSLISLRPEDIDPKPE